jgi:hypothetical protein
MNDHIGDRRGRRRGRIVAAFIVTYLLVPVVPLVNIWVFSGPSVRRDIFVFLNLFNSGIVSVIFGSYGCLPPSLPATVVGTACLVFLAVLGITRRTWIAYVLFAVLLVVNLATFLYALPGVATAY